MAAPSFLTELWAVQRREPKTLSHGVLCSSGNVRKSINQSRRSSVVISGHQLEVAVSIELEEVPFSMCR
jgi:hypothetical protein